MSTDRSPDRDERIAMPLDPEVALKALLAVDPDTDPEPQGEVREDD